MRRHPNSGSANTGARGGGGLPSPPSGSRTKQILFNEKGNQEFANDQANSGIWLGSGNYVDRLASGQ